MFTPSIPDAQVFTGLAAWLADALGLTVGVTVIQELGNRVAMPAVPFACMTRKAQHRISMNESDYTDHPPSPTIETISTTQPIDYQIQVDLYGAGSADWAAIVATMWRSELAIAFLTSYLIVPLWADAPIELSIVNGEEQYEQRWTVQLHMQFNPTMTAPMQFADTAKVNVVNAETL